MPLIIPHARGLTVSKNPLCKVGGRLDMTFADEICEVAETKTTYITDKLN